MECTDCGAVHFIDTVVANNKRAGIEWLHVSDVKKGQFKPRTGALIKDAVVIANLQYEGHPPCTKQGIVLPFGSGDNIYNNKLKLMNRYLFDLFLLNICFMSKDLYHRV